MSLSFAVIVTIVLIVLIVLIVADSVVFVGAALNVSSV